MSSSSSSRFRAQLVRCCRYNSFHAPPPVPRNLSFPYHVPPYNIPEMQVYPALYIPTADPRYPDHRQYIEIRRVGRMNFEFERERIKDMIRTTEFNRVSIDTEFPDTIYPSPDFNFGNPHVQYDRMKANVDELGLIQVGLTLSDAAGNLATWGPSNLVIVWEFVISDFDLMSGKFNAESTTMLWNRGLDFWFHREEGISSIQFAQMLLYTGLVWERPAEEEAESQAAQEIGWITFHGAYDFGYLIKALTNSALPETLEEFMKLVRRYFDKLVYDAKFMLRLCYDRNDRESNKKLKGGLREVAVKIGVRPVMGIGNQSGPDSLMTLLLFTKLKKLYSQDGRIEQASAGHIFPLAK